MKFDQGKLKAACLFEYFPNALEEVAEIATFGANKYERGGWVRVDNKKERYSDAMIRHLLSHYKGEKNDPESGMRHWAHFAWNALALLEIINEEEKNEK